MKKIISSALAVIMILVCIASFASCTDNKKKTVAIMQFGTHASLNNCYEGIIKGLAEKGITEEEYNIEIQNANFDPAVAQSQAERFVNSGADIIIAIATPSAIAAANTADGDIPVVFCSVTDAKVMDNFENTVGSSDRPDFDKQLDVVKAFMNKENIKIGVMLSSNEDSSPYQLSELEAAAERSNEKGGNIQIVSRTISEINTIGTVTDSLISEGVDCFVNLLDNTVVGKLSIILEHTNKANIPVFGSEVEQVKEGCMASASIDYVEIGRETGVLASKILLGEDTADNLENVYFSTPANCYNSKALKALGFTLPSSIKCEDVAK